MLVRSLAQELAAGADFDGSYITPKGTAGAISVVAEPLAGGEVLLNSSLYQWLLRVLGRPRGDESVEVGVAEVAQLPWPRLSPDAWEAITAAGAKVRASLAIPDPARRVRHYWQDRERLDHAVFSALAVADRLQRLVGDELFRPA